MEVKMPLKTTRVAGKVDMYSLRWLVIGTGTPKRLNIQGLGHMTRGLLYTYNGGLHTIIQLLQYMSSTPSYYDTEATVLYVRIACIRIVVGSRFALIWLSWIRVQ
jgi:hypothetical protein